MSDSVKNLISAIASGDAVGTEEAFNATMAEKISAKLDDMRISVSQNMFKQQEDSVVEEEVELTDEQISEELASLTEENLQGLPTEVLEALAEAIRVYDVSKSNQGVRPKTPEDRKKAAAAVKAARANKPINKYTGKRITGRWSAGAGQRQAGKTVTHIAVKD